MNLSGHFHRGELLKLSRMVVPLCEDADARGDLFAATYYRTATAYYGSLADDRPDVARGEIQSAMSRWARAGFDMIQFFELEGLARIDLYEGDALAARQRLKQHWGELARSFMLRFQLHRVLIYHVRASASLGAAAMIHDKDERLFRTLLQEADRDIRRLTREDVPWAQALTDSLRAARASLRGDDASARSLLDRAASAFDACEMALFAAVARRRLGQLTTGNPGRALVEAADAWMAGQGIKNPVRMTALFAPGFHRAPRV